MRVSKVQSQKMKRDREARISDPARIGQLVDGLVRHPPATPFDLIQQTLPFDSQAVAREMARRLLETELPAADQFQFSLWLTELKLGSAAITLLDFVSDSTRPVEKRALAFMVLIARHERELRRRVSGLPAGQEEKILLALADWLVNLKEQGIGSERPRPNRKRISSALRLTRGPRPEPPPQICRVKITLSVIRPAIWRRIEVPDTMRLSRLHRVFQAAMGWTDSHLHEFRVGKRRYGQPDPTWPDDVLNEKRLTLRTLVDREVKRFRYNYDFGDGWEHDILIEGTSDPEPGVEYPRAIAGRRACPPEDCGGPYGYQDLLEVLRNPRHPDPNERRSWIRESFDPEEFDLSWVNQRLREIR